MEDCPEDCPICLESLGGETGTLHMPGCGHRVHTACALTAAQYDVRCPVCRRQHESILVREEPESRVFSQIQEYAQREHARARRYQRRRATVIRQSKSLKKLNETLKAEERLFRRSDDELDKFWMTQQRRLWANDETIQEMKRKRRLHQRRITSTRRRLNARLEPLIGDVPEVLAI